MKRKVDNGAGRKGKGTAEPPPPPSSQPKARPPEAMQDRERLAKMVGRVLAERRVANKLRQEDLGNLCGLSRPTVDRTEKEGVQDSMIRMALSLGCQPSEILTDAERRLVEEDRAEEERKREAERARLGLVSRRDTRGR